MTSYGVGSSAALSAVELGNPTPEEFQMARNIGMGSDAPVFRAVIKAYNADGSLKWSEINGPYPKKGTAQARITFWKKHSRNWDGITIEGHIEIGETKWSKI